MKWLKHELSDWGLDNFGDWCRTIDGNMGSVTIRAFPNRKTFYVQWSNDMVWLADVYHKTHGYAIYTSILPEEIDKTKIHLDEFLTRIDSLKAFI